MIKKRQAKKELRECREREGDKVEYKREKENTGHCATKKRKRIIKGGKKERGKQNGEVKWKVMNKEKKEKKRINERIEMSE